LSSFAPPLQWQFFLGACLLAGAVLLPHAPVWPVIAGMLLAGVIYYAWLRATAPRNSGR